MSRFIAFIALFVLSIYPYGNIFAQQAPVDQLTNEIREQRQKRQDLEGQIKQLQVDLVVKQKEKVTLANQLGIIANRIQSTELEMRAREAELQEKTLVIRDLERRIDDQEKEIAATKKRLAAFLVTIREKDKRNDLSLLFASSSFSSFFEQSRLLEELQNSVQRTLNDIQISKQALEKQRSNAEKEKKYMEGLRKDLLNDQNALGDQQSTKTFILSQTRQSERQFQQMLTAARAEQQAADADIQTLERQLREQLQGKLPPGVGERGLIWPVSPSRGISAYFNDPTYPYRYIFEHPAIDIRTPQGTPIRAAAGGIVGRAKDAGMGYSYMLLVHDNGLSTVYGHVSGISVREGEIIAQGQTVGLTGGTPGTPGAGNLTTGPHLHLEVRKNGVPVNPLSYLP